MSSEEVIELLDRHQAAVFDVFGEVDRAIPPLPISRVIQYR
jgi:hypothetical protein